MSNRGRAILLFALVGCFGVLIFGGYLIRREKPPMPERVVTEQGEVVFTGDQVKDGQEYHYGRGGHHIGSIWGRGSYLRGRAPDVGRK